MNTVVDVDWQVRETGNNAEVRSKAVRWMTTARVRKKHRRACDTVSI